MFKELSEQHFNVATGLLVRLRQCYFVAACLILKKCFSLSQYASEYLQSEDMDLTSGVAAIRDLRARHLPRRSADIPKRFLCLRTQTALQKLPARFFFIGNKKDIKLFEIKDKV